ncbi:DUF2470 domain-containing protein [Mycobacterium sp. M1]|uniref:DUF2470 domain-containing protein n=1 Tax=Mycolicibacter acidiphilus TaxID=2835306 RepID=A0ABS5RLM9_9MYCO|nr:DUF2470 domain-containing protein [Mycolicibacter acidiphilus]MBS9535210.1 DUF2470 domain-containing protein [Mycolicibacter acidiphilus]
MTPTAEAVPTSAERIRSACIRGRALLAVADATDNETDTGTTAPVSAPLCHLLADGSIAIAVPAGDAITTIAAGAGVPAMLELTDHAPLPLRQRVRALAWIRGLVQVVPPDDVGALLDVIAADNPDPALLQVHSPRSAPDGRAAADVRYVLLRLTAESAVLADTTGAEAVDVAELLAARPDPFCGIESSWLQHLDSAHPELIARLAADRVPARLRRGHARPLGVDRYGIWLRVEGADGDHDVRLGFPRPVLDLAGLNRAIRLLAGCPFLNGLHARRG